MTLIEAVAIAILQGITEFFPISSLGHAVVVPPLVGSSIDQRSEAFLPFLVMIHAGTAAALVLYFWRDWWSLFMGIFRGGVDEHGEDRRRLLALIVVATIPAVLIGFAAEKAIRALFSTPAIAAGFLIANGFLLAGGEMLRKSSLNKEVPRDRLTSLSFLTAIIIGLWQCLAFLPGISRSGATMVGGLLAKLTHEQAARFSFLMATPVIAGATIHELPKLMHGGAVQQAMPLSVILIGGVVAAITAYLAVWFLMRYFKTHDFSALNPFAFYCVLFGSFALATFVL